MKKTKLILLSTGMALSLGAGAGVAVAAFSRNSASSSGTGSFDQVVNLYWGTKSTTASIAAVSDLSVNVPQYRFLQVSPEAVKTLTGYVTVSFNLATHTSAEGTPVLTGLSVDVFETDTLLDDTTVATGLTGKTAIMTLAGSTLTGTDTFAVTKDTTPKYYAMKLVYDGSNLGTGNVLSGSMTISQQFSLTDPAGGSN